ncbi:transposase family protein [Archangium violaceum]|nr:transposase family protein [Archangium violaceum]
MHEEASTEKAAALIRSCWEETGRSEGLTLHSDNGGPMKGATMMVMLQWLGIAPSFSRPRVSDDNPFSESLFRTLKYRPSFPDKPFSSLEEARSWVVSFVGWYNSLHRHSAIRFVTPDDRHLGREAQLLARRHHVYQRARHRHPER